MAQDVNDVIAQGFGSWSSVNWIPTLGFGIGAAVELVEGAEYVLPAARMHYALNGNRMHYVLPAARLQFETKEEHE